MSWLRRALAIATGAVVIAILGIWLLLGLTTDSHWLGTLISFGPKWVLLAPGGVLLLVAGLMRRWRVVGLLVLAELVVAGPVMGFCVPWRAKGFQVSGSRSHVSGSIKVLTCNTLGGRGDKELEPLVRREWPEVVALEECPGNLEWLKQLSEDWQVVHEAGLSVASRWPIVSSEPFRGVTDTWRTIGLRCELETPAGRVQFYCLHLLTPRTGIEAVISHKFGGLAELREITDQRTVETMAVSAWIAKTEGPKIIAGDLNLTPESVIFRREFGDLQDAFSTAGWGYGNTKFTRVHGVRIDHVLCDSEWNVQKCWVGPDVGSDHRPVIAELKSVGGSQPGFLAKPVAVGAKSL